VWGHTYYENSGKRSKSSVVKTFDLLGARRVTSREVTGNLNMHANCDCLVPTEYDAKHKYRASIVRRRMTNLYEKWMSTLHEVLIYAGSKVFVKDVFSLQNFSSTLVLRERLGWEFFSSYQASAWLMHFCA
jgi:hypothetical protein